MEPALAEAAHSLDSACGILGLAIMFMTKDGTADPDGVREYMHNAEKLLRAVLPRLIRMCTERFGLADHDEGRALIDRLQECGAQLREFADHLSDEQRDREN